MFSVGLVLAFAGTCLCQQQSTSSSPSQYQSTAVSQTSFQTGSAAALQQPQTKLEDIERDTLVAAFGQKTQQPSNKPSSVTPSVSQQQQQQSQQPPQSYQAYPQQQYFVQPYQALPQQFYMQPYQTQQQYLAQPYQMAFDYAGVQYSVVSPNSYPGNQIYQQYYVPAVPQPSAVPEYVTKQSFSAAAAAPAQAQQEYKKQQFAAPAQAQQVYKQQQQFAAAAAAAAAPAQAQQEYKQQQLFAAAPAQAQQEYKQQQFNALAQAQQQYKQVQQQYVAPSPAYQYVQQPAAPAAPSASGPADYSYVTRHPATTAVQFKAPTAAVQPQYQYNALPQQYQQQQQPQYYYTVAATEQPRVQQSAKSQFSSGVKSTTPTPLIKEQFAYKFESSPQQQPGAAAYSTLRYSA